MTKSGRGDGFTLIEIMLVVGIIGILAAMVVPKLTGRTKEAKIAVCQADVDVNIPLALDLYELDNGEFPSSLDNLLENRDSKDNWKGPYIKNSPKDPWGKDYYYAYPGTRSRHGYDLYSSGPDGAPGSEDDIVNWKK